MGIYSPITFDVKTTLVQNPENKMKLTLIIAIAVVIVGVVNCRSAPISAHGARHARSPQFGLENLFRCTGNCNRQGYNVGRSLAIAGAGVGALGVVTGNNQLRQVGTKGLFAGLGIKGASKLFGRR